MKPELTKTIRQGVTALFVENPNESERWTVQEIQLEIEPYSSSSPLIEAVVHSIMAASKTRYVKNWHELIASASPDVRGLFLKVHN